MADSLTITDTATFAVTDPPGGLVIPFEGVPTTVGSGLSMSDDGNGNQTIFNLDGEGVYLVEIEADYSDLVVGPGGNGPSLRLRLQSQANGVLATGVASTSASGTVTLSAEVDSLRDPKVFVTPETAFHNTCDIDIRTATVTLLRRKSAGALVGWQERYTNSPTFQGTPTKILSARTPVVVGRSYAIVVDGEVEMTTAASGVVTQHEIRVTESDTEPTTSSKQVGRTVVSQDPGGLPTGVHVRAVYSPPLGQVLRAAVVSWRPTGSTTCQWTADTDRPMNISIIDVGPNISPDGVVS